MAVSFDLSSLLGLPLVEAQQRLRAASTPEPVVVRSLPTRTRHELPAHVEWRVARARWVGSAPELVAVAAVPLPSEAPPAAL